MSATLTPPPPGSTCGGAAAAVGTLFDRYRHAAVRRCAQRTGDVALAEDAVQEGFIQVLQRVQRGDSQLLHPNPELVVQRNARWAAAKLMARDRAVSQKAQLLDDPSLVAGTGDPWSQLEMRWELEAILCHLRDSQRVLLTMRYVHRLPDAVSAARLGMSVKAFRCRLDRALLAARQVARRQVA